MAEWGNPAGEIPLLHAESIGMQGKTQGTEPSKYLEEKKSNEIPSVAASEGGRAQTQAGVIGARRCQLGVAGTVQSCVQELAKLQRRYVGERHGKAGRRG